MMPVILSIEEQIKAHETRGARLLSRTCVNEVDRASATRSTPLPDSDIKEGIYRIVQSYRVDGSSKVGEVDVSVSSSPSDDGQDFAVRMERRGEADNMSLWRITPAYGTDNGYFIVPHNNPGALTDLGATTYNDTGRVYVTWSPSYPVWWILSDENITFRKANGVLEDKHYFRIIEAGTNTCWKTAENSEVRVEKINDIERHTQLYTLVPLFSKEYLHIQSHQSISLRSPDGNVHRKLWVATNQLTKTEIARIDSVQITTDSHDQGWADCPQQGVWTWFELCILIRPTSADDFKESDIKCGPDGVLLSYYSHSTYLSDAYQTQTGKLFSRDAEIWRHAEPGNSVAVLACAQYKEWDVEGRSVKLAFHELVPKE